MKKTLITLAVIVAIIALVAGPLVNSYNKLVKLNESINAAWAQVDNQLQRRADLIPNLVATVKGYAAHEAGVFQAVSDARARLAGVPAGDVAAREAAETQMTGALSRLLAISEAYPQLKADTQFTGLRDSLEGTETRIATERMRYNEAVQSYNLTLRQFPMNVFGRIFGFSVKPYFQAQPGAQNVPKVNF